MVCNQENFNRAFDASKEVIATLYTNTHRIGGDYLPLKNDATLEMCKLMYQGNVVGYALQYRRPSFVPSLISLSMYDELLYVKTVIR